MKTIYEVARRTPSLASRPVFRWATAAAAAVVLLAGAATVRTGHSRDVSQVAQQSAPLVASPQRPSHALLRNTAPARSGTAWGVSFGGGFSDLSDSDLLAILTATDSLQGVPIVEPELPSLLMQGVLVRQSVRRGRTTSGL